MVLSSWRDEGVFGGSARAGDRCGGAWRPPRGCGEAVRGVSADDRAMGAAEAGDRRPGPATGARPRGGEDGWAARGAAGAAGHARRRWPRGAVRVVAGGVRLRGEHRHDESGADPAELDPEKKSLGASERDEVRRTAWRGEVAAVRSEDLVFLDETGSHLGYTPTHAWAPRGQRARATAPVNRGENKTVIAAMTR